MEGRVRRGGLEMSLMLARQRAAKAGNGEGETVVSPSVIASGKAGLLAANQTAALVSASVCAHEQNRCFPMTVNSGLDQIHALVAVTGLK